VAVVKRDGVSLDLSRIEKAPEEKIESSPAPYPHWTIKEIMDQPEALKRTLNFGARMDGSGQVKLGGLQANSEMLLSIKNLMISACGTSYFAGLYGARLMKALKCFETVQTMDAAEVTPESFPASKGGLLVISQSGETKDTHRSLVTAQELLLPRFSIVNQVGSLIARTTNCGVYLNAGREHAVASTKAFTTQVTALALVAAWFSQNRDNSSKEALQKRSEMLDAVARLPQYTEMALKSHDQCKAIAEKLYKKEHIFVLGKGYAEPIAYEGALKIKEITYIHAEGYSGGALKHGPFALLDKGTPVVMIILDDQHAELMRIAAQEVKARGAHNIIITDKKSLAEGVADDVIVVPSNGPMTALLAVVPLQLMAYEISRKKGINPDKPRHLAKAVTVD
jgi:glucosamine--fructose-6-phosphate aminotransferase (isomerizing)